MFTPALKADNFEYSRRLNQAFNARYIHLTWIHVKTRVLTCVLTCLCKEKIIIIQATCSSFSPPPYPPRESAKEQDRAIFFEILEGEGGKMFKEGRKCGNLIFLSHYNIDREA